MNKVIVIAVLAVVLFLIDIYVFQLFKTFYSGFKVERQKLLRLVYWGLVIFSMLALCYYHFGNPYLFGKHTRMFIMAILFMLYFSKLILLFFTLVDDVIRLVKWFVAKVNSSKEYDNNTNGIGRSEFLAKAGLVTAAVPFVSMSWGIISGAHDYRVRRVNVPIKDLPKSFEGLRLAQISDIHSGSFWNKTAVKGGVEMLLKEKPDLIVFTGDLVNNRANEMQEWGSIFEKIKSPLGVYSVLGNHDYGDYVSWESPEKKQKNLKDLIQIQKNLGWQLLLNENKSIEIDGESLGILGVENWGNKARFPKYGKLSEALKGTEDNSANILLSHDPSHWQGEVLQQESKVDLTLSGHTHGMQFGVEVAGIKWSPVQYMYKEWAGLYQEEDKKLYVNRGFGYLGYPGRVGIPPEITILTLTKG